MATAVAANGMWRFFGFVLHFSGAERAAMFGSLELAVVTCAFRARRNMRSFGSAGAEGLAVWVLAGLSAVFAALDARSGAEAVSGWRRRWWPRGCGTGPWPWSSGARPAGQCTGGSPSGGSW